MNYSIKRAILCNTAAILAMLANAAWITAILLGFFS